MNLKSYPSPLKRFVFKRSKKTARNRTVLAAMTNKQSHDNGIISDDEVKWLAHRAEGGFGIITTAATHVSKNGQGWEGEFGVFDDNHIEKLQELTNAVQSYGSLILAQLFHGGIRSPEVITGQQPMSASVLKCKESINGVSRSASEEDINNIIQDFTCAAIRCVRSGFDGIELHGAHGYLISQFLGTKTNMRKDKWGGCLKNRYRLLSKIIDSIKNNVPESFIVGVRISPEIEDMGIRLDDSLKLATYLRDDGIDFIHLSCWDVFANSKTQNKSSKTLTEWFIESIDKIPPVISTGNIWSALDAKKTMEQGADFIGVARAGIGHPFWAKNIIDDTYNPKKPPYSADYLKKVSLSENFIKYMRNWKGFVEEVE